MIKSPFAWNEYYEKQEVYNPLEPIETEAIEKACQWLGSSGGVVLDFGCGSGRQSLRILGAGARQIIGLDSSYHGISLARRAGLKAFSSLQTKWIWGSVDSLAQFPDGHIKGLMLSSILGYLEPMELERLAYFIGKLLDEGAKVVFLEDYSDEAYKQLAIKARHQLEECLSGRFVIHSKESIKENGTVYELQLAHYKAD